MSVILRPFGEAAEPTGFLATRVRPDGPLAPHVVVIRPSGSATISSTSSWSPEVQFQWAVCDLKPTTSATGWQVAVEEEPARERSSEVTRRALAELRRISGLTWDQLGELFAVARRSVHFWASGKPLNAANEERLLHVLDVVRAADRGDARSTRGALLEVTQGVRPFDLLAEQRYDEARTLLGPGQPPAARPRGELAPEARAARLPLPPAQLIDARNETVHKDVGVGRAARTSRNKRHGPRE